MPALNTTVPPKIVDGIRDTALSPTPETFFSRDPNTGSRIRRTFMMLGLNNFFAVDRSPSVNNAITPDCLKDLLHQVQLLSNKCSDIYISSFTAQVNLTPILFNITLILAQEMLTGIEKAPPTVSLRTVLVLNDQLGGQLR